MRKKVQPFSSDPSRAPIRMDKLVKRGVNAVKGVTGIGTKDEPAPQQQHPAPKPTALPGGG